MPVKFLFASKMTALEATAVPTAVDPISRAFNSPTTAVIPSKTFNSSTLDVMPSKAFNSDASAVTAVEPNIKPVVVTVEANVAAPAAETTNLFVPFVANVISVPSNAALELIFPSAARFPDVSIEAFVTPAASNVNSDICILDPEVNNFFQFGIFYFIMVGYSL